MPKHLANITYNFGAQAICLILGLISNMVVARLLGPEGKGIIALLFNYISISVIILMFGMSEGNVYYLSKGSYPQSVILSTNIYHTIFMSLIFFAISLSLKDVLLTNILKGVNTRYFFLSFLIFPFQFIYLHLITLLQGHKRLKDYSISAVFRSVAMVIFQIIFIPIWGVVGGLSAIILSTLGVNTINLIKLLKTDISLKFPNISFVKKSLFFGIKSQIGLLLNFFERRLDYFIINIFLDPIQVGYYSVAVVLAEIPWYFPNAVGTVIFPEITSKKKNDAYQYVALITRNTIAITIIILIVVGLCASPAIKLIFGNRFLASVSSLLILLPGILGLAINRVICAGFSGTGRPELGTLTVVFSSITTVILDFLLIPSMGINGAALASTISYFTSATVGLIIFHKISKIKLADTLFFKIADLKQYSVFVKRIKEFITYG